MYSNAPPFIGSALMLLSSSEYGYAEDSNPRTFSITTYVGNISVTTSMYFKKTFPLLSSNPLRVPAELNA
jgi:hypothetical protein